MRSSAPPSRSREADTMRSAPAAIGACDTRRHDVRRGRGNQRPGDDRGQQHVEAAHSLGDRIDVRLEHERVEEDPLRAAPDVEAALVARERPALAGGMPARCHPVDHDEARIGVQVVALRLREIARPQNRRSDPAPPRAAHRRPRSPCRLCRDGRSDRYTFVDACVVSSARAPAVTSARTPNVVAADKAAAERRRVHPARSRRVRSSR